MQVSLASTWRQELRDVTRGISGAFLFGMPLLFTMEMWWIGIYAEKWKLLAFLTLAFLANLGLSYFAGFKRQHSLDQIVAQAVEATAVGAVAAGVVLLVLNRITPADPLDSILGKIIVQTVPLSIGASVANIIFQRDDDAGGDDQEAEQHPWRATFNDLGATLIGSIFIGFSIAPTDEVTMLAAGMDYPHLLTLIGLTLALAYGIVFASGFDIYSPAGFTGGPFQHPLTETVMSYAAALLVAFVSLYLLDVIHLSDPMPTIVAQTLVLGLPATIGGAAGRLAI
jgi:putative integral membrane protein (TIGR02587 family)